MRILETERLYLRPYKEEDCERLSEIYSDEEVMKYIGRGGAVSKDQTKKGINAWINRLYPEYGFGIWALIDKKNDLLIGHCGFNKLPEDAGTEIAYLLAKDYWGKGIATEISKATLKYGFANLKLNRIVALAYPQNVSSINVIRKLGMKPAGEKTFFDTDFLFFEIENESLREST